MSISVELPLFDSDYYEYTINFEGESRIITFMWNYRSSCWHFDIRQDDLTPIVLGVKLVPYYPMLSDYQLQDHGLNGYLYLTDSGSYVSNKLNESIENLAKHYRLFYIYEE